MIELPKRIGNISDTDYLQEQIDSMKHQLDNSIGGSATTIANLSVENLEVKGKIDMGKNTSISWLNIKDTDDVAYVESVEETKRAIKEVEEIAEQARSTANTALGSVPSNYVPYTTYIDGSKVITETLVANNLLIKGGGIDIASTTGDLPYRINSNGATFNACEIGSCTVDYVLETGPNGVLRDWTGQKYTTMSDVYGAGFYSSGSTMYGQFELSHVYTTSNATAAISAGNRLYQLSGSSQRYKHDIHSMDSKFKEDIRKLYDVEVKKWTYNDDYIDPEDELAGAETFGLIAEDVERVLPGAVTHDKDGNVTNYRDRHLINAMLVLLQEQNKRIEELERRLQVNPVE